jgi:hypothetical protein
MSHSTEVMSPEVVKTGLVELGITQDRAARKTRQSPALVSMVLSGKARSQPCLRKLSRLIERERARTGAAA